MPAPPPPPPPSFSLSSSNSKDQGRNMLLQSIRSGASLKKTVTVDKSTPAVTGKIVNESSNSRTLNSSGHSASPNNNVSSNFNNGNPQALGSLFSGGMPKLKPTGLRANMTEKDSQSKNNSSSNAIPSNPTPSVKRGPPPLPPPAAQKPQILPQASNTSKSTAPPTAESPRGGYGKLNLAPKPPPPPLSTVPRKPSPPPKKPPSLAVGNAVFRAQSMRLVRSSPSLASSPLSSLHQSQDRLNETAHHKTLGRVPLRPPVARPPSPPKHQNAAISSAGSSPSLATTSRAAPPPPSRVTAPSIPPPPPPLPSRAAPSQPRSAVPNLPPTPPTRNTLPRNGQVALTIDLEARFADLFHTKAHFPLPESFRNISKVYNSKNAAKQQAPPPPPIRTTSDAGAMHGILEFKLVTPKNETN